MRYNTHDLFPPRDYFQVCFTASCFHCHKTTFFESFIQRMSIRKTGIQNQEHLAINTRVSATMANSGNPAIPPLSFLYKHFRL
jgi:hypothetical protein